MSRGSRLLATLGWLALVVAAVFLWMRERDDIELGAAHAEPANVRDARETGAITLAALEPDALASEERAQTSRDEVDQALWRFRGVVWNEQREPLELFGVVATRLGRSREVLEQIELPLEPRAGGRFEFANLTPGHWEVAPFAPDRVLVHKRIFRERDAGLLPYLLIRDSEPLELDPATALVSGTVLDSSGEPAEKAVVTAYRTPLDEWDTARLEFELAPVASGAFSLRLEPGHWTFVAQAKGWNDSEETEVTLSSGQVLTGLSLQLDPPTRLRFFVAAAIPARPRSLQLTWEHDFGKQSGKASGLEGLEFEVPIGGANPIDWCVTCPPDERWVGRLEVSSRERSPLVRLERLPPDPVVLVMSGAPECSEYEAIATDPAMGLLPAVLPQIGDGTQDVRFELPRPGRWLLRHPTFGGGLEVEVPDVAVHVVPAPERTRGDY